MNVALPKEGVCKKRKEKVSNFQSFSGGFKPILLACKEVPQSLCAGASVPLWVDTTSSGRSTLKQELRGLQVCSCAQEG